MKEEYLNDYADKAKRKDEIDRIYKQLCKKRKIKKQIKGERKAKQYELLPTPPEAIPVLTKEVGKYICYPASVDDLLAVMRVLPAGVLDGLSEIHLTTGAYRQQVTEENNWIEPTPDPLIGRQGYEMLPGIYSGLVIGTYCPESTHIELYAYVLSSELPDRDIWMLYLRLYMLSTFVHEVAHHYDFINRVANGRWRFDSNSKIEIYAENIQHQWIKDIVVPYLKKAYPTQLLKLNDWLKCHIGISLPLEILAGDPRTTTRDGTINIQTVFDVSEAVIDLAKDIYEGKPSEQKKFLLAYKLYCLDYYKEALHIVLKLTYKNNKFWDAHALLADIYVQQEKLNEAESIIENILTNSKNHLGALEVLVDIHEKRRKWTLVEKIANTILYEDEQKTSYWRNALCRLIQARVEMKKYDEAEKDLLLLESQENKNAKFQAERLRKKYYSNDNPLNS